MIINFYNKTATFKRFDSTLDETGAPVFASGNYDDLHTNISCRLCPMSGEEKIKRMKKVADRLFFMYCQVLSIREDDIVVVDSEEYKILSFIDPGKLGKFMKLELEQNI